MYSHKKHKDELLDFANNPMFHFGFKQRDKQRLTNTYFKGETLPPKMSHFGI